VLKKMSQLMVIFSILALAASLLACSFFDNLFQPKIPASAQGGLEPGTARILGNLRLVDWAEGVSSTVFLTIFEGRLAGSGVTEMRVFLSDGQTAQYVGALSDQLQLPGVQTLFIDFGSQRCVVGWVSPATPGKLLYFHIERPEADTTRWMEGVRESTLEKNLFIVPIRASDQPERWNLIAMAAVQTRESLQRGFDAQGSYYEVEKTYSPPLDVSSFYIPVSIPK
jgi:hypothetical protein